MPDFLADLNVFRADLEGSGLLVDPAFAYATITGIIDIDAQGNLLAIKRLAPKQTVRDELPRLPRRTSNPVAAFLTGSVDYWFNHRRKFQRDLHERVLAGVDDPGAAALLSFLARDHDCALSSQPGNCALRLDGEFIHRRPALREAWLSHYQPDPDPNPRVRIYASEAFIRLGTRSNLDSGKSYDDNLDFLGPMDPAGAGRALDWMLDRPTTVRHQDTAAIAWLDGDPFADPTPMVCPLRKVGEDWRQPAPINTLHVALLKAYPPARMHLRWYWSGDATVAFERLAAFDRQLRSSAPHYFVDAAPVRWPVAFAGTARWADMSTAILQAVLSGRPIPRGVMMELVRLHRKPRQLPSAPLSAALLETWAASTQQRQTYA